MQFKKSNNQNDALCVKKDLQRDSKLAITFPRKIKKMFQRMYISAYQNVSDKTGIVQLPQSENVVRSEILSLTIR